MQVIGLCGYAGSGKDTAAEALIAEGWQRVSFADPIREMALAIDPIVNGGVLWHGYVHLSTFVDAVGWESAKKQTDVRRLLQRIGTEAGRNIHGEDVWVLMAQQKIREARRAKCPGVVITDLRFENERELLQLLSATIIRISRPNVGPVNDHQSDRFLADFEVDHEIVNDGDKAKLHAAILAIAKGETK